jgi:hypothetical protein
MFITKSQYRKYYKKNTSNKSRHHYILFGNTQTQFHFFTAAAGAGTSPLRACVAATSLPVKL